MSIRYWGQWCQPVPGDSANLPCPRMGKLCNFETLDSKLARICYDSLSHYD
ncbi:hypothetical protein BDQ94DRAFT_134008, partial [Aspergillus welwitschiae]